MYKRKGRALPQEGRWFVGSTPKPLSLGVVNVLTLCCDHFSLCPSACLWVFYLLVSCKEVSNSHGSLQPLFHIQVARRLIEHVSTCSRREERDGNLGGVQTARCEQPTCLLSVCKQLHMQISEALLRLSPRYFSAWDKTGLKEWVRERGSEKVDKNHSQSQGLTKVLADTVLNFQLVLLIQHGLDCTLLNQTNVHQALSVWVVRK